LAQFSNAQFLHELSGLYAFQINLLAFRQQEEDKQLCSVMPEEPYSENL
jgi:hypothetical protein